VRDRKGRKRLGQQPSHVTSGSARYSDQVSKRKRTEDDTTSPNKRPRNETATDAAEQLPDTGRSALVRTRLQDFDEREAIVHIFHIPSAELQRLQARPLVPWDELMDQSTINSALDPSEAMASDEKVTTVIGPSCTLDSPVVSKDVGTPCVPVNKTYAIKPLLEMDIDEKVDRNNIMNRKAEFLARRSINPGLVGDFTSIPRREDMLSSSHPECMPEVRRLQSEWKRRRVSIEEIHFCGTARIGIAFMVAISVEDLSVDDLDEEELS
jgi:hypothetical protein